MERHLGVLIVLQRVDETAVERARIDVKAYGALVEDRQIQHLVDRLFRIDLRRQSLMHIKPVRRFEPAIARRTILIGHPKVLHSKLPQGYRHPAILILVVMDHRYLTHLPANRQKLEQLALEDQVPRVMVPAEEEIGFERLGFHRMFLQVIVDCSNPESRLRDGTESSNEL